MESPPFRPGGKTYRDPVILQVSSVSVRLVSAAFSFRAGGQEKFLFLTAVKAGSPFSSGGKVDNDIRIGLPAAVTGIFPSVLG